MYTHMVLTANILLQCILMVLLHLKYCIAEYVNGEAGSCALQMCVWYMYLVCISINQLYSTLTHYNHFQLHILHTAFSIGVRDQPEIKIWCVKGIKYM